MAVPQLPAGPVGSRPPPEVQDTPVLPAEVLCEEDGEDVRSNEVRVDSRGHINVNFRKTKCTRYLYEEDPDGTIHLYPAVLVPAKLLPAEGKGGDVMERERDFMEVLRESFPDAEEIG